MRQRPILRRYLGEPGSLRARSIETALWSFGGLGISRALSLVSNLIMTRLLLPEAFGLIAVVITIHVLAEMTSDIGVRQSVVRSERGADLDFLRTAWSVQIVRSFVVAGIVLIATFGVFLFGPRLSAPDSVYSDPHLPALMAVSTLVVLFRGMQSTAMFLAARQLQIGKVTLIEIGSQFITLTVMIILAQFHPTVWVLLFGLVFGSFVGMILTHLTYRDVPMRWHWDKEITGELWTFGRWLIGSSIAGFIVNQGDKLLVGALLDKTTFGFYVIALIWVQTGDIFISQVTDRIGMPVLSETLRSNRAGLRGVLAKVRLLTDGFTVAGFLGLLILGPVIIQLLYEPEYAAASAMIGFLGFRILTRRQAILNSVLLATGHSRGLAASIVVGAILMPITVPLTYRWLGLEATLLVIALIPLAGTPILLRSVKRALPEISIRSDVIHVVVTLLLALAAYVFGVPYLT
ncbi:oligosaccharide flippase family protein [Paracoccus sp. TK19116]|uniref:Oligosaccharide flippase family protein n=1 Tax=Paracoccus albicereus TaxID=2922394 RepID=A0ABT1MN68_9RHOB|nr:oligosaccharide flippase family protein [Paracoccus albicereus]MCQ0969710.1 oligosaccharide flippase family protein [Paracoccus albicereus]